ncbi:hypothetical protein RT717_14100 [Imperialibacter roseus]|uniref:Uncharacterized protein n=1 Tax=Imperialibacter roseus TaxID=1324217 RepID=A0ABZ0IIA6_9BACT|nr:hypothetical protein [Imperialibacter roseus]WOK04208.1 hypothetical protein RT717_14100 [Imperialibacter roseus]
MRQAPPVADGSTAPGLLAVPTPGQSGGTFLQDVASPASFGYYALSGLGGRQALKESNIDGLGGARRKTKGRIGLHPILFLSRPFRA